MKDLEFYILCDKILEGTASQDERKNFEEATSTNEELKLEFECLKKAHLDAENKADDSEFTKARDSASDKVSKLIAEAKDSWEAAKLAFFEEEEGLKAAAKSENNSDQKGATFYLQGEQPYRLKMKPSINENFEVDGYDITIFDADRYQQELDWRPPFDGWKLILELANGEFRTIEQTIENGYLRFSIPQKEMPWPFRIEKDGKQINVNPKV